jgi:hypothetical protein
MLIEKGPSVLKEGAVVPPFNNAVLIWGIPWTGAVYNAFPMQETLEIACILLVPICTIAEYLAVSLPLPPINGPSQDNIHFYSCAS